MRVLFSKYQYFLQKIVLSHSNTFFFQLFREISFRYSLINFPIAGFYPSVKWHLQLPPAKSLQAWVILNIHKCTKMTNSSSHHTTNCLLKCKVGTFNTKQQETLHYIHTYSGYRTIYQYFFLWENKRKKNSAKTVIVFHGTIDIIWQFLPRLIKVKQSYLC